MIQHIVTQGSQEWHDLRSVIPTASEFHRILTPAKWEPTKGDTRRTFQLELLANRIFGLPADDQFSSAAMQHGRDWEPIARARYEFEQGVTIEDGGFWTDDAERYGASPDGLIGDDGLVEFKNPQSPKVYLEALLDSIGYQQKAAAYPLWTAQVTNGAEVTGFLRDHWAQVQGQLLVTGRKWCDLVSNFARLPMVVVRVHPNPTYQALLQTALDQFCGELDGLVATAKREGWIEAPKPKQPSAGWDLGITDEDVEAILAARRV